MSINEERKYIKRNANRPNFLKGRQSHIPSQTIGNAKVHINSESAKQKLQKLANKYQNINDPRGFLTDLRNALGIPDTKGVSKYGVVTIPKEDGTELIVSLRITNHQANANTYIEHGANYEYNLSIVIRRKVRRNTFIPNDNVVLDEFVYYGNNLQKVESPLSKIAEGLIEYLTIGRYEDKTGVALPNVSPQPNTNNKDNINCNRNMNKNRIRLTESQLHKVIKESIKKVLNESKKKDPMSQWFKDFDKASKYRETMDYIGKDGQNPKSKKGVQESSALDTPYFTSSDNPNTKEGYLKLLFASFINDGMNAIEALDKAQRLVSEKYGS